MVVTRARGVPRVCRVCAARVSRVCVACVSRVQVGEGACSAEDSRAGRKDPARPGHREQAAGHVLASGTVQLFFYHFVFVCVCLFVCMLLYS